MTVVLSADPGPPAAGEDMRLWPVGQEVLEAWPLEMPCRELESESKAWEGNVSGRPSALSYGGFVRLL